MFFVQVWLRVLASQQCYRKMDWGLVKTWDYGKKQYAVPGDKRRWRATVYDRASDAWTILTLMGCLWHMGSCLRDRWRIRDRLMKAAANRDDAYFRSFHKNMRDFDSLEKSEVLTESRAARAVGVRARPSHLEDCLPRARLQPMLPLSRLERFVSLINLLEGGLVPAVVQI